MSTRRQLTFAAALACLILLACEVLSWVGLSIATGRLATWARLAKQREAVVGEQSAGRDARRYDAAPAVGLPELPRRHRDEQALHPFLGFVMDAERHPAARRGTLNPQAIELGFPWNVDDLLQPPGSDRVVVALLGGSVAVMLAQDHRELLRAALARVPAFRGLEVVVLTLANYGYKQPQQLATLNYFLALGARIDVAINLDGFNEVALPPAELIPQGAFLHFPQSWIARVAPFDPELQAKMGELAVLRSRREASAERFSARPWRWSFTAGALWSALDRGKAMQQQALEAELARWDAAKLGYAARGPRLGASTTETVMAEIAGMWQRASLQMHLLSKGLGIRYFHFLQPNQYDPGSKPLSEEELRLFYQADHAYRPGVEAGYPLLRQAGQELVARGVAFHDLSRLFASTSETLYVDSCCHLNQRGNALLAQAMADALTQTEPRSPP